MPHIIAYSSLKSQPWANGGGVTRQIAAGTLDNTIYGPTPKEAGGNKAPWDWRISLAEVAKAGPFSPMPGIDRVLTIIDGDLIAINVDGTEIGLEKYRPYRFSGDSTTEASLPTGSLGDLNVMTRRGLFKGFTTIVELSKKRPQHIFEDQFGILLHGQAEVVQDSSETDDAGPAPLKLSRLDTVVGSEEAAQISGRGFLAVVSIDRVSSQT